MSLKHLLAAVALAGSALVQAAPAAGTALPRGVTQVTSVEGITEYKLANGLQVLLVPDDSKPTTTVNVTYRVGSRHENYGETGMAHLLEHLLFKGSTRYPTVWAEFTKRGLRANGTTWFDRTNYFASFSANEENLRWYLGWQADAMVNSFIARKDLDTEMTVVRNEMEMGENSPDRVLFEKTLATMYQWHNYGKSTIGARADVENVDIPRLQAFYRQYYQPDNATLIVAGKFDVNKTLGWIAQDFGKLPRPKRKLPTLYTIDPVQDGERSVTLRRSGGVPMLFAAYHVPSAAHPDYAAIEALNLIAADAPAGRLHKRLVEKQLAAAVFSFSEGLHDPGFTLLGAQLAPGQDVDKARGELLATIEGLGTEPVTDEELKRAQAKWIKGWEMAFTNPETVGVSLSESVAQGDWRLFFLLRDRVRDLKLADVQRVAKERFLPSNRTLGTYVPTDAPQRAPLPVAYSVAEALRSFKPQAGAAAVAAFDTSPANLDARTQKFTLPSGMQVALLPKPTRGNAVQARLTLRFGDEKSLFGQGEIANQVAEMLDKGTAKLSRQQIQDKLNELQTTIGIDGGAENVQVSIVSKRDQLPAAIALVGELLREPSFPPDVLEELRRQALTQVEQARKEPEAIVGNALARHGNPYPRGDVRYARSFDEMVADVQAVKVEQLKAFHQRFYGASNAQFGAAGDFDPAAVRAALEAAFGNWKSAAGFTRVPQPLVAEPPARLVFNTPDKQNATMAVQLSMPLSDNDADYPALYIANWLLGTGGDSRLWKRIRESGGLSYDVRSYVQWSNFEPNSTWVGSAIFAPQNRAKVEAAFKEEVARALKDGYTAQELESAKRGALSFRRLNRAQDAVLAGTLASNLYLKRDFALSQRIDDAIAALTVEQVNAALRKYLKPDQFVFALGGEFKD